MRAKDIVIGNRYNNILIIKDLGYCNHRHPFLCKCALCGKEFTVDAKHIGVVKSCKECSIKSKIVDLTGQRFGMLVALKYVGRKNGRTLWLCKCDCGNDTVTGYSNLLSGNTRSCGCLEAENRKNVIQLARTKNLKSTSLEFSDKNKLNEHPLRGIWESMLTRCYNPKHKTYKDYGGRGISVCNRWRGNLGFENFVNDMGERPSPRHSIGRIDVNGNYCPENCRWATMKQQANNKRDNVYIVYDNNKITVSLLCELLGIKYYTAIKQINKGVDINIVAKGVDMRTKQHRRNPLYFNGNLVADNELTQLIIKLLNIKDE